MSPPHEYDLLCIGSGPTGQRAAIQAAKLGKKVAVIEHQQCLGGVCIATGTIPSKTFREAVSRLYATPYPALADTVRHTARLRPSMAQLLGQVEHVMQREMQVISDALERNEVEVWHGQASFVRPHTLCIAGPEGQRQVTAEHILIAVGTTPTHPQGLEPDGRTVVREPISSIVPRLNSFLSLGCPAKTRDRVSPTSWTNSVRRFNSIA